MIRLRGRRYVKRAPSHTQGPFQRLSLYMLDKLDLAIYTVVGLAFVGAAGLALFYSGVHLLQNFGVVLPQMGVVQDVLDFVSDLLLVLIIMEVLGTVRSYLEKRDTSVEPFVHIGIISATRGILSIGARLYVSQASLKGDEFRNAMIELSINALVIIVLGATLRIMGYGVDRQAEPEVAAPATESSHAAGEQRG
jgi:uncharacterized membrane protein (DUF373 family)